jgi:hypothetical protein
MDPPTPPKTPPFDFSNIPDPSVDFFKNQRKKMEYVDSLYGKVSEGSFEDAPKPNNINLNPSESNNDFGSSFNKLVSELPLTSELNHSIKSSSTLTNVDGTPLTAFEADMVSRFKIMHDQALKKANNNILGSQPESPIMKINVINKIHPSKRDLVSELKSKLDSKRSSNLVHK